MNKKSVAASTLVVFMAIFFAIIGICFSSFVFTNTKIVVQSVKLTSSESIEIFEDEELRMKANELKLSNMDLGLKPATGKLDDETQIPSTINDEGTSEGYYSTIYVKAEGSFKIFIKDIKIESKKDALEVKEERENIYVAIKDVKDAVKNLESDEIEFASFSNVQETQKLVIYIWLDSLAGDALEGATISFTLDFVAA